MPTARHRGGIVSGSVNGKQERLQALELAIGQIEKQFGRGAIMRL